MSVTARSAPLDRPAAAAPAAAAPTRLRAGLAILVVSLLALYLELVMIRWVGTEIRIFAYLQNTILVVCFLGLGTGCFTCHRPARLRDTLLAVCGLLTLMAIPATRDVLASISERLSLFEDFVIWAEGREQRPGEMAFEVGVGLALTAVVLVLLWAMFVPLGRLLGRLLAEHPNPIRAYSLNVAGSLLGTWLLVGLSVLTLPPPAWFALVVVLALPLVARSRPRAILEGALLLAVVGLSLLAGRDGEAIETTWSPYQKLSLRPADPAKEPGDLVVRVNNVGYQAIIDLGVEHVAADPRRFPPALRGFSQYDLPCRMHADPRRVLIVGAGTGNDAAGALRNGAGHVTAVEIDPVIVALGERLHPERPYQDERVEVVNEDARSYFAAARRRGERFDVIVFGLLDSHTTHAMTNARLDHYVYTRESLAQVRELLAPEGLVVLTFEAARFFIADRMSRVLADVFGRPPVAFKIRASSYGWGGVMFLAGDLDALERRLEEDVQLGAAIAGLKRQFGDLKLSHTTPVATDDWPYIYLERPRIPSLYYLLAGLLVVLFVGGLAATGGVGALRGWGREHWHFFCLGAAFLLLEVQNISKACVALGNTWQVNSVIISGVLLMILLANLIGARFPRLRLGPVYVGLLASCLGLYFLDLDVFAALPYGAKVIAIGVLTTIPMLFAGIVFVRSFAVTDRRDQALGANLFGALVGGLLQSLTFVTGVKGLLLIVAAGYAAVWLTRPRAARALGA